MEDTISLLFSLIQSKLEKADLKWPDLGSLSQLPISEGFLYYNENKVYDGWNPRYKGYYGDYIIVCQKERSLTLSFKLIHEFYPLGTCISTTNVPDYQWPISKLANYGLHILSSAIEEGVKGRELDSEKGYKLILQNISVSFGCPGSLQWELEEFSYVRGINVGLEIAFSFGVVGEEEMK